MKEKKKVRRPNWDKDSYWEFGTDQKISYGDDISARVHLNQIDAKDWEIYEEKEKSLSEMIIEAREIVPKLPVIKKVEIKEFLKKESKLIRDFRDEKITWNKMISKRLKLIGKKLI